MFRIISLSVLLTLIVALGVMFFRVLVPFVLPLFLASVFAILCQPLYEYFIRRTGYRLRLAAGLTTGTVVALILVPLIVGTVLAALQLFSVAHNLSQGRTWRERTDPILQYAADFINEHLVPAASTDDDLLVEQPVSEVDLQRPEQSPVVERVDEAGDALPVEVESGRDGVSPVGGVPVADDPLRADIPQRLTAERIRELVHAWLRDSLSDVGSRSLGMAGGTFNILSGSVVAIGSALLAFVIFAVALYYFLADGIELIRATERLIPVHVEYQREMLQQFARVVRAVVLATFFAALAQSVATVAALAVLGFPNLFVIFLAALLMSMIPMLGTWLVWLPCAAYLLYEGHPFQALFLAVYGAAFIGTLDNVVRTYILNTDVKLHPLLALISVLGGLQVMGLWGMFVGPIVASCLHALVKIFNLELAALSKEKFAGMAALETPPLPPEGRPPVLPTPPQQTVAGEALPLQNGPEDIESKSPSTAPS